MIECIVENCHRTTRLKYFCNMHYLRDRHGVDMLATRKELLQRMFKTHGMSKSTEYSSYNNMKNRCYWKKGNRYENYGGRGIIVCDRWLESFENFLEDMGKKPSPLYTIERRDVNGNYEPDNCFWATPHQQAANKRNSTNHVGVYLAKKDGSLWEAVLQKDGKKVFRERFKSFEEALAARKKAEKDYL